MKQLARSWRTSLQGAPFGVFPAMGLAAGGVLQGWGLGWAVQQRDEEARHREVLPGVTNGPWGLSGLRRK